MNRELVKYNNIFGKHLKSLRIHQLNLTQVKFAERIQITYEKLGDLERGKNLPSYYTIINLRKDFNLNLNTIVDETIWEFYTRGKDMDE